MTTDNEDVNPDEASSTSSTPDAETKAPESSTEASAADKGSQSAESELPNREALIAQLTGKTKQNETPAAEEDDESETEVVEPDEETETETVEAKGKPADKTVEVEADKDLTDEEIEAPLGKEGSPGARKRIQHLLKQRKERDGEIAKLKPAAEFGQNLLDVAGEARMEPAQLGAWIALAAEVNKDPSKAGPRLLAEAERIAQATGTVLPRKVETLVPKELDEIEEMLISDLADGNIPADVMKKYREKIRTAKAGKATAPTPPPVAPVVPVQQQPTQTPNAQPQMSAEATKAVGDIAAAQAEFKKKYPANWDTIQTEVSKRIGKYAGTHPSKWAEFYRTEVKNFIESQAPVRKAPSTQPLRPTTTTTTAKPISGKSAALAELTGRKK